jgi:predicted SnoaL-like aldol condensation-catalyzing enzyme
MMHRWVGRYVITGVLLVVAAAPGAAQSAMNAREKANLQFVLDWWREVLQARHVELAPKYQAETYIQHNINIQTGRDGFVKFFGARGEPTPIQPTLANPPAVAFAKGDYVVLVWEREAKDPADPSKTYKYNAYDLLRLGNGKVQEHWDWALKAPKIPYGGAPDGIDYDKVTFDLSPQEKKNLEIATVEFKDILQYGHVELAEKVMAPTYIQHNPNVPTGRAGFVAVFSKLAKPRDVQPRIAAPLVSIVAERDLVVLSFVSEHPDPSDKARKYTTTWFDMFRIENGRIAEHWDGDLRKDKQ